jgi:hypothetical protein
MSKVVVMIEDDDGRRDWWEVFRVSELDWTRIGSDDMGAVGRVVIEGSFFRKATDKRSREIGEQMRAALEGERHGLEAHRE